MARTREWAQSLVDGKVATPALRKALRAPGRPPVMAGVDAQPLLKPPLQLPKTPAHEKAGVPPFRSSSKTPAHEKAGVPLSRSSSPRDVQLSWGVKLPSPRSTPRGTPRGSPRSSAATLGTDVSLRARSASASRARAPEARAPSPAGTPRSPRLGRKLTGAERLGRAEAEGWIRAMILDKVAGAAVERGEALLAARAVQRAYERRPVGKPVFMSDLVAQLTTDAPRRPWAESMPALALACVGSASGGLRTLRAAAADPEFVPFAHDELARAAGGAAVPARTRACVPRGEVVAFACDGGRSRLYTLSRSGELAGWEQGVLALPLAVRMWAADVGEALVESVRPGAIAVDEWSGYVCVNLTGLDGTIRLIEPLALSTTASLTLPGGGRGALPLIASRALYLGMHEIVVAADSAGGGRVLLLSAADGSPVAELRAHGGTAGSLLLWIGASLSDAFAATGDGERASLFATALAAGEGEAEAAHAAAEAKAVAESKAAVAAAERAAAEARAPSAITSPSRRSASPPRTSHAATTPPPGRGAQEAARVADDACVRIWRVASSVAATSRGGLTALCMLRSAKLLATAGVDATLCLWDALAAPGGRAIERRAPGRFEPIRAQVALG
ncbi:hypothetical protein T492DRAFT_864174, partial [Pavlovales sp. CCMP2436]